MRIYIFLFYCCYLFVSLTGKAEATPATLFVKKIDYNAGGQATRIEYGNGMITTKTYDSITARLKRIYSVKGTDILQDLNYTYDSVGNIVAIADAENTADQAFIYDALNRLKQAVGDSYGTKSYAYDKIGNITAKEGVSYAYSKVNAGPHAVTSLSDGSTLAYDLNGNPTSIAKTGQNTTYTYDRENRLSEVKKNSSSIGKYFYDGDGGRTAKISSGATTHYAGSLYESTGGVGVSKIFLGSEQIATVSQDQVRFYAHDHLGGINVVTNSSGSPIELMEFKPYGEFARHEKYGGSQNVSWEAFTGKPLDNETGLMYFGARYYSPFLGRFLTPDTVVQSPMDPQTFNRYSYCGNNPVNRVDPSGHSWLSKIFDRVNKFFRNTIEWLEKVTNSKWSVNVEVGQTHKFQDIKTLGQNATQIGFAIAAQPWQMGVGFYRWVYDPRFEILETMYDPHDGPILPSYIEDGDKVFINGILNSKPYAIENANKVHATKVGYNPSDGALADLTESFLQKMFFTSSIDRQLAQLLIGHKDISLAGHSQGAIIVSNTLVNLGIRNAKRGIDNVEYINTQITKTRGFGAGMFAGVSGKILYSSRSFDFSNALGPNLTEPYKFISGVAGMLFLPLGMDHHGIE